MAGVAGDAGADAGGGDGRRARAAIVTLLGARAPGATLCPSEVARVLADAAGSGAGPADWRGEMAAVHAAVDALVAEGAVRLSSKGVAMATRAGAYRIGRGDG